MLLIKYRQEHSETDITDIAPKQGLIVPSDYTEQTCETLPSYIEENCPYVLESLDASTASDLSAVEMGDGNLNLVFIVTNTKNSRKIIVKQVSISKRSTLQRLLYYQLIKYLFTGAPVRPMCRRIVAGMFLCYISSISSQCGSYSIL